jgi:hypothetical protein
MVGCDDISLNQWDTNQATKPIATTCGVALKSMYFSIPGDVVALNC